MKANQILSNSIALALLGTSAIAADVEVRITGATAFRAGAMTALKASFDSGGSYTFAHNQTAGGVTGADRATFKGSFPGVTGTTTVRVSWNGSVEGIRAVALGGTFNPAFIQDAALAAPGTDAGEAINENALKTGDTLTQLAKFSFSDVRQTSTPVTTPVLNPAVPRVGVVVFSMVTNEGAPAAFDNVTQQQFKSLFKLGSLPLSIFTANPLDDPNRDAGGTFVYAVGRNDGSGTRTSYMAETGLGITGLVNQYVATSSYGNIVETIKRTAAGDAFRSTVWGQDTDGNGGYFSGSAVRTDMARTSASTNVLEADGSDIHGAPVKVLLLSFLSNPDARNAAQNGGKILKYNGYGSTSLQSSSTLSVADIAAVTEGQNSAWNFQNLYYSGSLLADEATVYNAIKAGIPATLAPSYLNGIPLTLMNVSRPDDGAPIAP